MRNAAPGLVTLEIYQFGLKKPDRLVLRAYAEAASLDHLTLSAGETVALLKGRRLDEVATAELEGIVLIPAKLSRVQDADQLALHADGSTSRLDPAKPYFANVQLRDGRQLKVPVTVEPPRPRVTLLSKGSQNADSSWTPPVTLGSPDDLPVDGRLVFFLRSSVPVNFPRDEKVEVAATDGSFHTELAVADGSLMLEDAKTAEGSLEPLSRFGSSAFGPIRVRALAPDGSTGDWLPLGTLVREPGFKELRCTHAVNKPCTLTGTNLFLATSIAATQDFENAADVPPEFTGTQLSVPHPVNGVLYVKLRDDPATTQTLTLPVTLVSLPATKANPPQSQPVQETQPAFPETGPAATPETPPASPPPTDETKKPEK
jgi:hypothetical protein